MRSSSRVKAVTSPPLLSAARRRAPWLIVHGEDDPVVPLAEARALDGAAAEPRELHAVPGGDHTFGARHPFSAMNATQTWLKHHG